VNPHSNISIGYTYISTNQNQGRINENNLWQQYNFSYPVNRIKYFGWIRIEQRWIKKPITSDNKFYSLKYSNEYNTRIRFRAGFELPLIEDPTKNLVEKICYCKPGTSALIKKRIEDKKLNFKKKN